MRNYCCGFMIGSISLPDASRMLGQMHRGINDGLVMQGHLLYIQSNVSIDRAEQTWNWLLERTSDLSQVS